ncbi:MAG: hypothetical protein H0W56_03600 [Acidothermales bacterium]|jgi:hypothetical protein|nr:hypothetical protein [Acidothermales bacterium]
MRHPIEPRLEAALHAEAQTVPDVPGLGERVVERGRRVRRRRRGAAGAALVCAMAVLVGGPSLLSDREPAGRLAPIDTPSAEPSPKPSSAPSPDASPTAARTPSKTAEAVEKASTRRGVERVLARLPHGAPPAVPFMEGSTLHVSGQAMAFPNSMLFPRTMTPYGALVIKHGPGFTGAEDLEAQTGIVNSQGEFRAVAEGEPLGAAVSPDGDQVALGVLAVRPGTTDLEATARVVDLATGGILAETPVPRSTTVLGWYEGAVVLSTLSKVSTWVPGSKPQPLDIRDEADELSGDKADPRGGSQVV